MGYLCTGRFRYVPGGHPWNQCRQYTSEAMTWLDRTFPCVSTTGS